MWHAGFIWDDDLLLTANSLIKSPHGWYQFWFTTKTPDYFPVMSSFFWVEWRLWGMNAVGYHVVNVLLHAVNAILLWRLLARLNVPGAGLAAAIFALHPVNAESVAWIAELKNTLSLFFFALSLLWYLKFDDTGRRRCYWLALGAFLLALLSKIEVAPLPFVLLGIAWWRRGCVEWKDLRRSVPFFAAALLLGLVSVWFQNHNSIGHDVVRTDNFWSRLAGAGWAVWFYFGKTLLPVNLIPIYPRWQIDPTNLLSYVPGLLLLAGFVVLWRYRRSWGRAVLFGLGYAVLMFLPVLGFLNIYFFRYSLVANHWQYFSIIGPVALAAAGITMASGFLGGRNLFLKPVFYGALLLALGVLTWRQCQLYRDAETLWRTTIERNPACWLACNNLGEILLKKGQVVEAIAHFNKAIEIKPNYANAHSNLGNALLQKGQVDEAIIQFQKALAIQPDFAEAHNNLGDALFQKGQVDEAIIQFQKALAIQPDFAEANNNLGTALFQKRQLDESIVYFRKALAIQPDYAEAHNNLGNALLQKGQTDEAILHYKIAISIKPDYFNAHNNLGKALLDKGLVDEAIIQFQKALVIKPDNAEVHNNLGAALCQKGQVDEAIVCFQKALVIQPDFADAHCNLGNALVQKGQSDEAILQYLTAIGLKPDYFDAHNNLGNALLDKGQVDEAIIQFQKALVIKPDNAEVHNNLGTALVQKGQSDEAIVYFQKALAIQPDNAEAHDNLAQVLLQKGEVEAAIAQSREALKIRPDYANAHKNLGAALFQKGQVDEAIIQFQRALAIQPGLVEAQDGLTHIAWVLATSPDPSVRNGTKAVELARQTDGLSGGRNPMMATTLAAAYAEAGRFPEAITTAQRALQLATSQNDAALVAALKALLKLYQAGSPFRDTGTSR